VATGDVKESQLGTTDIEPTADERATMARNVFESSVKKGVQSAIIVVEQPDGHVALGVVGSEAELMALFNVAGDQLVDMIRKAKGITAGGLNG
jgi:hypothetical protein